MNGLIYGFGLFLVSISMGVWFLLLSHVELGDWAMATRQRQNKIILALITTVVAGGALAVAGLYLGGVPA